MARIRTIKPEFPHSESIGRLSRDARLTFMLLWTICDDSGRARGNSRMLASLLFPYDEDAPSLIEGWLTELAEHGLIRRYIVGDSSYLDVPNWLKHQRIDKPTPSKLPEFAEDSRGLPESSRGLLVGVEGKGVDLKPLAGATEQPEIEIPLRDGRKFAISEEVLHELDRLYPGVDTVQTLNEIRGWNLANPKKRKTRAGVLAHVHRWFRQEQERSSERKPS